ncbi:MAG TPA: GNAT family N-acetyltransferase [Mycobacteriales bacterium]|nr:GNAT family N-acetyltransferase [Mycobacteriales bacterium]
MHLTVPGVVVGHDRERRAYVGLLDGTEIGRAEYVTDGERVVMDHTVTEPAYRGRGVAAAIVRYALEDLRAQNKRLVPACWFVRDFIQANPEYRDLLGDDTAARD